MKNLLFIIAFIPVVGFSQVRYFEVSGGDIEKKKNDWYKRTHDKNESKKEFFAYAYSDIQGVEFVIVPEIYNSTKDTNIVSIEFIQDTTHFHEDYKYRLSNTTKFDNNYSIGLVRDFMVDKTHVALYIKTNYKDGTTKVSHFKMHLDYTIMYYATDFKALVITKPIDNEYEEL